MAQGTIIARSEHVLYLQRIIFGRTSIILFRLWPKPFKEFEEVKVFLVSLSLIIALFVSVIFLGVYWRSNSLLIETVKDQAASYFGLIERSRIWNTRYGSIFVEKKEGVETNRILRQLGIEPDVRCDDGRVFTMRNHAIMTKEISLLTGVNNGVKFHLRSLKPLNPENAPDAFEREALEKFERGGKEAWMIDRSADPPIFRYMAPLYIEESCLYCHGHQGYRVGEVRGGIGVYIPLTELDRKMRSNRLVIVFLTVFTISLLLGILYFMIWKLVLRLNESRKQLRQMSVTDELTGLRNRRFIIERLEEEFQRARRLAKPMGLIMLDLDHFKQINDLYGHLFGDLVLKTVASRMRSSIREYDLLGRIGGEEFLIVSPDSDLQDTLGIAERIREIIKEEDIGNASHAVRVTVSAGVTQLGEQDPNIDILFSRADTALYTAKQEGRDRVIVL